MDEEVKVVLSQLPPKQADKLRRKLAFVNPRRQADVAQAAFVSFLESGDVSSGADQCENDMRAWERRKLPLPKE